MYPKSILLSAGNSFSIPVSFRPIAYRTFQDSITFSCDTPEQSIRGKSEFTAKHFSFKVDLNAVLPEAKLKVPKKITIEPCAVLNSTQAYFPIINPTEDTTVTVNFECSLPFSVEKTEITLAPKSSEKIVVNFEPQRAGLFKTNIKCHFYDTENTSTGCVF